MTLADSETIPVRAAHRFDEGQLIDYLAGAMPGVARGAIAVRQMRGGQSNPTFLVEIGADRFVLRKQPPGELLPSAHAVDREFRVISALAKTDVPVPRAVLFCAEREVIGTPFYLMECLEGRVFRGNDLPGLAPAERGAVYDAMGDVLARLHKVDPAAVGLGDYGRPGSYFQRQIARWSKQWQMQKPREIPALEKLIAWLETHQPADDGRVSIIHGDYRVENLMFAPDRAEVIGVLDWELSTLGHPLADLAYNCMPWHMAPEEFSGLVGLDLAGLGIPSQAAYVAAYFRRTGLPGTLELFHLAFSMFRMSVILEGVYARGLAGNASNDTATTVGALGKVFAERAWALVEG